MSDKKDEILLHIEQEHGELAGKIDRLDTFITGAAFDFIRSAEQIRLIEQRQVMREYLDILTRRIYAWGSEQ